MWRVFPDDRSQIHRVFDCRTGRFNRLHDFTSGMSGAGFHQCVPMMRPAVASPSLILPIGMTDVLLARMAPLGASSTSCWKIDRLTSSLSGAASVTNVAPSTAAAKSATGSIRCIGSVAKAHHDQVFFDSVEDCRSHRIDGFLDADSMPSGGKHLSNADSHQAATYNRDAGLGHGSARRVSTVGIEGMPCVKIGSARAQEKKRPGKIFRLAQSADRYARQEAATHVVSIVIVCEHPGGQGRSKHRWGDRIYG